MKPVYINRKKKYKKNNYKIYIGRTVFKPLRSKRTKKSIKFKRYQQAKKLLTNIKRKGVKGYIKKC